MGSSNSKSDKLKEFTFPTGMYYVARFFNTHPKLTLKLHRWESKRLRKKMEKITIDRPVYITGLTRAGTTIILVMLSKLQEVANHRYLHMVNPFIPHWIQKIANMTPLFKKPVERLHKDRMAVTRESPEAVEEIFWQFFFNDVHNEKKTNVFDFNTSNPEFENFYQKHIKKLLINQNAKRYAAKNNYNISRMEYIQKIFPDVKFLIIIRNPINHIASLMKQHRIFKKMEEDDKRLLHWTKIIGHREFGTARVCINVNNTETVEKIRELWNDKKTEVKGWAIYWASIYEYMTNLLQKNKKLADTTLLVRYEDLCDNSGEILDQIIGHIELSPEKFKDIKEEYKTLLKKPTYYKPSFNENEIEEIKETTLKIAKRYDYF